MKHPSIPNFLSSPSAPAQGDYLFLPAGTPHRVEQCEVDTLWLAVHLHPDSTS